jgi:Rieske Fe-S protein
MMLFMPACNSAEISSIPAVPVEMVIEAGGLARLTLPITVHHSRFELTYYDEHGERRWKTYDAELFPTDVFIAYNSDRQTARVFVARSPHKGCLLNWIAETQKFEDPCYGSRFSIDGAYESGPAPRNLDELPAEVRDQMIWMRNEIVYGESHK